MKGRVWEEWGGRRNCAGDVLYERSSIFRKNSRDLLFLWEEVCLHFWDPLLAEQQK